MPFFEILHVNQLKCAYEWILILHNKEPKWFALNEMFQVKATYILCRRKINVHIYLLFFVFHFVQLYIFTL